MNKTIASDVVFEGNIMSVRVDRIQINGDQSDREIVDSPGVSAVFAMDNAGRILTVRQYRHPVQDFIYEIPAGRLDKDESPEACARRELAEETGYCAHNWYPLGSFYSSPGFCTERVFMFGAKDLYQSDNPPRGDEHFIEHYWMNPEDLIDVKEAIMDAKMLAAISLWRFAKDYRTL